MKGSEPGFLERAAPANRSLRVEVEQRDDAAVITPEGSAGILEAERIRSSLDELLAHKVRRILVDLHGMSCVGAVAVAAVVASYVRGHQHQGDISLIVPENTGLDVSAREHLMELLPVVSSP